MTLDDDTYLERFHHRDLGPEHFDHIGHLRMAWLHLKRYGFEDGNQRVCEGIRDLATQFGAPEKFNRTLTEALMRILYRRMRDGGGEDFEVFLESNPDLVDDARSVLARYYSDDLLHSDRARTTWTPPDRAPMD